MADDRQRGSKDGPHPSPQHSGVNGAGAGRDLDRLPPPAFPPGQRGHARVRPRADARRAESADDGAGVPDDAFISPDEPIVRQGSRIAAGAFISPDEPIPNRDDFDPDQVVVTGMGDDPHLGHEELALSQQSDPGIADLVARIRRLADALRDKGEAGLRTTPDMSRFDATLRAYCVGYLAAQREIRPE